MRGENIVSTNGASMNGTNGDAGIDNRPVARGCVMASAPWARILVSGLRILASLPVCRPLRRDPDTQSFAVLREKRRNTQTPYDEPGGQSDEDFCLIGGWISACHGQQARAANDEAQAQTVHQLFLEDQADREPPVGDLTRLDWSKIGPARRGGETVSRRLLAVVVERGTKIRVVTAYGLDAGQKKDYLARRLRGE
jgi:hypothetical protein